jgi:carboxylate-amine ligase
VSSLEGVSASFARNVRHLNLLLEKHGAMLLPTAAHPFMNPHTDTVLWPYDNQEIYNLYNRIFDCRGHGWSNLQSTHINLPFQDDAEFRKLHAAIRVLLPLIPVICASSPLLDSKTTGYLDSRMHQYLNNQKKIPVLTGKLIPEPYFSQAEYESGVLTPIAQAILPFDPEKILEPVFLNSRGAIARFDRWAIEIRVMDIQECPAADVALVSALREILKLLAGEKWQPVSELVKFREQDLLNIFMDTMLWAGNAVIKDTRYLRAFGLNEERLDANGLLGKLYDEIKGSLDEDSAEIMKNILNQGALSQRIIKRLGENFSKQDIINVYRELAQCLEENKLFL